MSTAMLAISTAIRDAFTGAPELGRNGRVLRGRDAPLPAAEQRGVRVNSNSYAHEALDITGTVHLLNGLVLVTALARASGTEDGESAIDDLIVAVRSRLRNTVMPAGVKQATVQGRIDYGVDEADQTVSTATLHVSVTATVDPATLALVT